MSEIILAIDENNAALNITEQTVYIELGNLGVKGDPGESATITVGTTTTGAAGSSASVVNSGTPSAAILDFTIPKGDKGDQGEQGIQGIQGIKGDKGDKGDTGATGATGATGQAATIAVGTTTTGSAGTSASVTNVGTSSSAVFDFVIPKGADGTNGTNGTDGAAATIAVGTVTTGSAGSSATVTNVGTSSAAVFDFSIPQGAQGATGATGATGAGVAAGGTAGQVLAKIDSTDYNTTWVNTPAPTIFASSPATWDSGTSTVGVDQDAFTHISNLDYASFDTTYATGSTQPGQIAWNDTDGTLEFQLKGGNVTLQVGQEQVIRVQNSTGATIANGSVVYINGSTGSNVTVAKALATNDNLSATTIGVVTEDLANAAHGFVTTAGLVRNIDTSALTEGAPVYLSGSTAGGFTSTKPVAPTHLVLVGFCVRSHATTGAIFVHIINGFELEELHNVAITSPVDGQAVIYNSTSGIWENGDYDYGNLANVPTSFTPSAHASTHGSAGSDPITIAPAQVTGTAVITTDSRLSDARTPTAHAASHQTGGTDVLSLGAAQIAGTAVTQADTATVTNTMLANSSITVNGSAIALGGSGTVTAVPSGTANNGTNDLAGSYPYPTLTTTGITAGTYTKLTVDAKGRATAGATLSASDIPTIASTQVTGTAVTRADSATVTNTMLVNNSITLNGTAVALGGSATISGGGVSMPDGYLNFASTYYYRSGGFSRPSNNGQNSTTSTVLMPFYVHESTTFDRIACYVITSASGSTARLAIYDSDANGVPSNRVLDAGTVATTTTGLKAITINQTLAAGLYWLGGAVSTTTTLVVASFDRASTMFAFAPTTAPIPGNQTFAIAATTSSFPTAANPTYGDSANYPMIVWLRKA